MEGGFDQRGRFVHVPFGEIQRTPKHVRRMVIESFLNGELISAHLATRLINWKHSGFAVNHTIRIPASLLRPAKPYANRSLDPRYL